MSKNRQVRDVTAGVAEHGRGERPELDGRFHSVRRGHHWMGARAPWHVNSFVFFALV